MTEKPVEPVLPATTLGEALRLVARAHPRASTHYPGTGQVCGAAELDVLATGYAGYLRRRGVGPGDLVGLVHGTGPDFLACLFGTLRAGAAASVLPVPNRSAETARGVERIGRIVESAAITQVIVDTGGLDFGARLTAARPEVTVLRPEMEEMPGPWPEPAPDDLAVVQFTSGTTDRPRGVMLTHRAVLAGLRAILISAGFTRDDVLVQWIPTYHDMGLFGLLSQVLNGASAHVFDPMAFLRDPAGLLRHITRHGGTVTTGPNFGYDSLAEAIGRRGDSGISAAGLRLAFNGSEPVRAATVERWEQVLGPAGMRPEAMYPVYGMAEATLAVAFPAPGRRPRVLYADHTRLADGAVVRPVRDRADDGKALVGVGRPVHGIELRIVDAAGRPVGAGTVGEIQIRGEAVTTGYYRDPAASRELFDGPWLRTGDLGFLHDGDLFITGRRSEMVIVYGRNYFPEDAEAAAGRTPGVHRGRCVAFRLDGESGEGMGVAVETALPPARHPELESEVRRRVSEALGLGEILVRAVPPGWVTRTTSGKPQRLLARQRLRDQAVSGPA